MRVVCVDRTAKLSARAVADTWYPMSTGPFPPLFRPQSHIPAQPFWLLASGFWLLTSGLPLRRIGGGRDATETGGGGALPAAASCQACVHTPPRWGREALPRKKLGPFVRTKRGGIERGLAVSVSAASTAVFALRVRRPLEDWGERPLGYITACTRCSEPPSFSPHHIQHCELTTARSTGHRLTDSTRHLP